MKKSPFKRQKKQLFVATEGMYTGQFVYCGKKVSIIPAMYYLIMSFVSIAIINNDFVKM